MPDLSRIRTVVLIVNDGDSIGFNFGNDPVSGNILPRIRSVPSANLIGSYSSSDSRDSRVLEVVGDEVRGDAPGCKSGLLLLPK